MKKTFVASMVLLFCSITTWSLAQSANEQNAESATPVSENVSRYPVADINALPEDIKQNIHSAKEQLGFIPNFFKALGHRPDQLKAFEIYNKAAMNQDSGLSRAEKEMIIVVHSISNHCTYCVVSHGAMLRKLTGKPLITDQITTNYHEADISPRQKAMLDFALKVTTESHLINEEDFKVLHKHGFSNEDIWDIAAITAFYNMSNRMMNFLAVRPDLEFSKMARK